MLYDYTHTVTYRTMSKLSPTKDVIDCKIVMLYITVYEAFSGMGWSLWQCGGAQVSLNLHQDDDIHTSSITLIDAPSIIHQGLITSQGVVLYLTN